MWIFLRPRRVGLEVAGHAVVEAHAACDQQIRVLNRRVDPGLAVHPHHSQVERIGGGEAADAEERHRHRDVGVPREGHQRVHRPRNHHPVAGEDDRPLRVIQQRRGAADGSAIERRGRLRDRPGRRGRIPIERRARLLRVLGDVDEDRPRPPRPGHGKRLADGWRDVRGVTDKVVVLGDRQRDAGDVRLLKRVRSDQAAAHLPGDADDGGGVHHRGGDAGDHVGRAGPRRRDRHADAAGRTGVAVRHVRGALLVTDEHVTDRELQHRVVRRQDGAARIPEHVGHALADQAFPEDLCAGPVHALFQCLPGCGLWQGHGGAGACTSKRKGPSTLSDDGLWKIVLLWHSHHPSRSGMPRTTPTIMTTPKKRLVTV